MQLLVNEPCPLVLADSYTRARLLPRQVCKERYPEWDAIGLSFSGVPVLLHIGRNARVARCVTDGRADYWDLFIERFDESAPLPLRVPRRVAGGRACAVTTAPAPAAS